MAFIQLLQNSIFQGFTQEMGLMTPNFEFFIDVWLISYEVVQSDPGDIRQLLRAEIYSFPKQNMIKFDKVKRAFSEKGYFWFIS